MNLSTKYLGLTLKNPIVPSSSPLMESLDNIRNMEDAGAAAVVLHSLFEEQVTNEALELHYHTTQHADSFAEAQGYFPEPEVYTHGGEEYVEHLRKVKQDVDIPVIGSLNGVTAGGWLEFASQLQEAGADAVELNLYHIPTDPNVLAATLDDTYVDVVRAIKAQVSIPVAVKLSPFFTSMPNMAQRFKEAGADGLVLFNRFYQPDINVNELTVQPNIILSCSDDIRLRLRWMGLLYGRVDVSLAATGGVHQALDAIKLLMAGADITMMCSSIFKHGVKHIGTVLNDLTEWMEDREYESIEQLKGSMSQQSVEEPAAFERALYIKGLKTFHY